MSHTAAYEAALEIAREVRNLTSQVLSLVKEEERQLTQRDNADDRGNQARVDEYQDMVDLTVATYRELLEGRLLDLGVTKGVSEDDDIQTCRLVADWTLYAIVSTYPKVKAS